MSPKKQYQKRLPTVLPPAPRAAPAEETLAPEPPITTPASSPPAEPTAPTAPPTGTPVRSRRPRRSLVALAAAWLLAALSVGAAVRGLPQWWESPSARPEVGAEPSPSAVETRVEESYTEAQVRPDGVVVVQQWIRAEGAFRRLTVTPPDLGPGADATADGVRVTADGAPVAGARTIGAAGATYRFDAATVVRLRYRMDGAVQVSDPTTGRALVLATSMDVRYAPRPVSEIHVVRAPSVLSLACAPAGDGDLEPCGADEGEQWRVELPADQEGDRVVAVVDLGG